MSSAFPYSVSATSATKEVLNVEEWIYLVAKLQSGAGGTFNRLGLGGSSPGIRFDPGDMQSMILAPGTRVEVQTDSVAEVEWSFVITPLPIREAMEMLLHITNGVCAIETIKEVETKIDPVSIRQKVVSEMRANERQSAGTRRIGRRG